jgi:hypothetical protein
MPARSGRTRQHAQADPVLLPPDHSTDGADEVINISPEGPGKVHGVNGKPWALASTWMPTRALTATCVILNSTQMNLSGNSSSWSRYRASGLGQSRLFQNSIVIAPWTWRWLVGSQALAVAAQRLVGGSGGAGDGPGRSAGSTRSGGRGKHPPGRARWGPRGRVAAALEPRSYRRSSAMPTRRGTGWCSTGK